MKIVIAFDSFKGSLSAEEVCSIVRETITAIMPEAEIVSLPIADGGEGTTAAICQGIETKAIEVTVHDPLLREITASYAITSDGKTAIMEMASAAGLTLLAEGERNVMRTTTVGVGEMMQDAIERGCKKIIIGIGGSATNDCGLGLLSVFGLSIYDDKNNKLQPFGGEMHKAKKAVWQGGFPKDLLKGIELIIASDVDNNLYGKDGAAYVYARQKGCTPKDIETLDNGLRNIADLLAEYAENKQFHLQKGAGAAGGLGYALMLLGGEKWSGAELVLKANNLDAALRDADFVLTGEGKLDKQTLMGKAPFIVMQHAKAAGTKTFGIAGCVEDEESLTNAGFNKVFAITPPNLPLSEALQKETAKHNLTNCINHLYTNYLTDL